MEKQLKPFKAYVPKDFLENLIQWQMADENSSYEDIQVAYGESNKLLADRIAGTICEFTPDLGYACEDINGTLCFEVNDKDGCCIPVGLLIEIEGHN